MKEEILKTLNKKKLKNQYKKLLFLIIQNNLKLIVKRKKKWEIRKENRQN